MRSVLVQGERMAEVGAALVFHPKAEQVRPARETARVGMPRGVHQVPGARRYFHLGVSLAIDAGAPHGTPEVDLEFIGRACQPVRDTAQSGLNRTRSGTAAGNTHARLEHHSAMSTGGRSG